MQTLPGAAILPQPHPRANPALNGFGGRIPMNWKTLAIPVLAAVLVPHGSPAASKKTFVMVPKGVHPYYEPCYEGFKAAAQKYDVNVDKVDPQKLELPPQAKEL